VAIATSIFILLWLRKRARNRKRHLEQIIPQPMVRTLDGECIYVIQEANDFHLSFSTRRASQTTSTLLEARRADFTNRRPDEYGTTTIARIHHSLKHFRNSHLPASCARHESVGRPGNRIITPVVQSPSTYGRRYTCSCNLEWTWRIHS
jgi:hypothetical protein